MLLSALSLVCMRVRAPLPWLPLFSVDDLERLLSFLRKIMKQTQNEPYNHENTEVFSTTGDQLRKVLIVFSYSSS